MSTPPPTGPVASLTIVTYPWRRVSKAFSRMGLDRAPLRAVPGLRFWKLMGVGRSRAFSPYADLRRWGLFCVWADDASCDRFLADSEVALRWRELGGEPFTIRAAPVRWHGRWGGRDPFAGAAPEPGTEAGAWAILTRATIRGRRLRAFWGSVEPVAADLDRREGLVWSLGIGEAPLVRQCTFSVWRSLDDLRDFAYEGPHRQVIDRTRAEGWYSEELFARLRPYRSEGQWNGQNPLAGVLEPGSVSA